MMDPSVCRATWSDLYRVGVCLGGAMCIKVFSRGQSTRCFTIFQNGGFLWSKGQLS